MLKLNKLQRKYDEVPEWRRTYISASCRASCGNNKIVYDKIKMF